MAYLSAMKGKPATEVANRYKNQLIHLTVPGLKRGALTIASTTLLCAAWRAGSGLKTALRGLSLHELWLESLCHGKQTIFKEWWLIDCRSENSPVVHKSCQSMLSINIFIMFQINLRPHFINARWRYKGGYNLYHFSFSQIVHSAFQLDCYFTFIFKVPF